MIYATGHGMKRPSTAIAIIGTYIASIPVAWLLFLATAPAEDAHRIYYGIAVVDLILGLFIGVAAMVWSIISWAIGYTQAHSDASMRYGIDMVIVSMALIFALSPFV